MSVLPEVAWLVASRHGELAAARAIARIGAGSWPVELLDPADIRRSGVLMERYADAALGFVDASIIALAERLGISRVYTLDRRDFALVRPDHVPALELLPHPARA